MEISPRPRPVEPPADRPHLMSENMAMASPLNTLPPDSSPTKANRSRDERLVFRKPVQPASASRPTRVPSIKTDLLDRRRSIQREGPPLGPRPLERVGGKRFFSAGTSPSYRPTALPQSASMSILDNKLDPAGARQRQSSGQLPGLLPSINFDNFQTSMGGTEFEIKPPSTPSSAHYSRSPDRRGVDSTANSFAPAIPTHASTASSNTSRPLRRVPVLSVDTIKVLPTPSADQNQKMSPSARASRRQTLALPPNGLSRATAPTWSSSAKVVQQSPRHQEGLALPSPTKPMLVKSPSRPAVTPTSLQRQSGRMSGLGARTISPTDAKRLRRISLAQSNSSQHLPPQPQSQPEVPPITDSPALLTLETNLIPAATTYTPESLVPSTSSSSSLNTYVTAMPRLGHSPSLSRLPLLKGRNVYSSNGVQDDELVPPVPAIPKAYESPMEQVDTPFFTSAVRGKEDELSTEHSDALEMEDHLPTPRPAPAMVESSTDDNRLPLTPAIKKRPPQTRLPPMNVLPLSTPTAARIASFNMNEDESKTPTKIRNYSRTPTTPMTASKATFAHYTEDPRRPSHRFRTSTSQNERIGDAEYEPFSANAVDEKARQITPFSSRSRADFTLRPDEYHLGHQGITTKVSEPFRQRATSHVPGAAESNIPLRRKFSLTWRRTSAKGNLVESVTAPALPMAPEPSQDDPDRGGLQFRSDRPRPASRSTSWSAFRKEKPVPEPRCPSRTTGRAEDEAVANSELRRMSGRRKDVDSAARETDRLLRLATPKQGLTPSQAVQSPLWILNIYEKGEIIDYREGVYFCGNRSAKKHVGDITSAGTTNFGYDDERGDYSIVVGDHLAYRYEIVDFLGKGSFGQVVRCIDHQMGGLVAVKIIRNKKRFHQQALVEVNILKKLKDWDPDGRHATLSVTTSFYFRAHLCIVTPCLSINLYELIRANSFQGFSLPIIRRFAQQILGCLELLQDKRVIHCDLKPENILLCDPRRADIRVIDFGSSCRADEKVYTYIQSRFYRSPEVILGNEYGLGIDMWSFGCILAELFTGYPIFPGENEQEQLACVMEVFGPPPRSLVEQCTRRKLFFDSSSKPRVTISSKGKRRRPSSKTLSASLKCVDEPFLDFITQCLAWDPKRRLRPDQAVDHPFINNEPLPRRDKTARSSVVRAAGDSTSPTKRLGPQQTPRSRTRPLPEPPSRPEERGRSEMGSSTAIRSAVPVAVGVKRQAAVVGAASAMQSNSSLAHSDKHSDKVDMAAQAARESMGWRAGAGTQSSQKWRP